MICSENSIIEVIRLDFESNKRKLNEVNLAELATLLLLPTVSQAMCDAQCRLQDS